VHAPAGAQLKGRPRAGLSKLNSVNLVEVDIVLGDPSIRTATAVKAALPSTGSGASGVIAPDSLERR
jgi:hypothetical protein